jgi:hypothetical protein
VRAARIPDTRYISVDCYAADPSERGHVLDPFHHGFDAPIIAGAQLIFEIYGHATMVGVRLDFTGAGDPGGHLTGRVLCDGAALDGLGQACRFFLHHSREGMATVDVYDDGGDYYGHYGDDRPPDTLRELHVGRTGAGDLLVYLRLDLVETHGVAPTVWLDRDQIREVADYASDLAGEL